MSSQPAQGPAGGQGEAGHAARYEVLRAYAVGRRTLASREGLIVLLRLGVAGWMEAWSKLPEPPPRPVQVKHPQPPALRDDASAEVIRVLAAMTLTHLQEAPA